MEERRKQKGKKERPNESEDTREKEKKTEAFTKRHRREMKTGWRPRK